MVIIYGYFQNLLMLRSGHFITSSFTTSKLLGDGTANLAEELFRSVIIAWAFTHLFRFL
jgi:hypothetical protein